MCSHLFVKRQHTVYLHRLEPYTLDIICNICNLLKKNYISVQLKLKICIFIIHFACFWEALLPPHSAKNNQNLLQRQWIAEIFHSSNKTHADVFVDVVAQTSVGSSSWIIHNIHDDLVVNETVFIRGSKTNQSRKCCAFHPVVMADSCFERCPDLHYKTVCVVFTRRWFHSH